MRDFIGFFILFFICGAATFLLGYNVGRSRTQYKMLKSFQNKESQQ